MNKETVEAKETQGPSEVVAEDIPVEEEVAGPKTATTPKTYTPKPRSKQTQPQVEVGLVTLVYNVM